MTGSVAKVSSDLQNLSSNLLSTLDEAVFFSEMSQFMAKIIDADRNRIYMVLDDQSALLIAENGKKAKKNIRLNKGEGVTGHVVRTKKSYFSNNVARDPMFQKEASEGVKSELCLPIACEGHIIGTIHFQVIDSEREFSREDITKVISLLNEIEKPLRNMKMYLSAKFLNESLVRKIEAKDKELQESRSGLKVADTFKIQDKEIIGKSDAMKSLISLADKIAATDVSLLIKGESGTGKEMIARRIHCRSARGESGFISLDCTAFPEAQLEVELFGEEVGDFSNGHRVRVGLLESANNGTLFLNNIHALSLNLQSKLTNFLNEKMAFRVGGQVPYRSDIRLIVATTRDLNEEVEKGSFRDDLSYFVSTMFLEVPALRERREDIELLGTFFLNLDRSREDQKSLSPCVIKSLRDYNWPGNVRELQNVMERAFIMADGIIVERDHLADSICESEVAEEEAKEELVSFAEMTLDELEKRHICQTLEHLSGNKTKTAKMLGITVKTLYNKLHSYGMIAAKEA